MSTLLDTLVNEGEKAFEVARAAYEADRRRDAQIRADNAALLLAQLREAVGLNESEFESMNPSYNDGSNRIRLVIDELEIIVKPYTDSVYDTGQRKVVQKFEFPVKAKDDSPRQALARSVAQAATERNGTIASTIESLTNGINPVHDYWWSFHNRTHVWNHPAVIAARLECLLCSAPGNDTNDTDYIERWLKLNRDGLDDNRITQAVVVAQKRLDYLQKRDAILEFIQKRRDPATDQVFPWLNETEDEQYRSAVAGDLMPDEIRAYAKYAFDNGIHDDESVGRAIAMLNKLMMQQVDDRKREAKRAALEGDSFYPFVFYRIYYGVVATADEEDPGAAYIETESFDTLASQPNASGFYPRLNGKPPVKVAHLVKVERISVTTLDELKALGWARHCMRGTDYGKIVVPPDGATVEPETEFPF